MYRLKHGNKKLNDETIMIKKGDYMMNARNRIERLLNMTDPALTISNIPKSFSESAKASMMKRLNDLGMEPVDCCCYLTNIIARMERALKTFVGEPHETYFVDHDLDDPTVFHGEPAPEDFDWAAFEEAD